MYNTCSSNNGYSRTKGFTLVEVAIVLVIIGLIVGGILLGKTLIRQAELRSVIKEHDEILSAIQTFNVKYNGLPGDLKNATNFWGTAVSCPGDYANPSIDARTCNGNGDGRVSQGMEPFRIWHHLSNAGLIAGTYTGVTGDSGGFQWNATSGNSPRSKINSAVWASHNEDNSSGTFTASIAYINLGNLLMLGGVIPADWPATPVLTPLETYSIDVKLDDGLPMKGKMLAKVGLPCNNAANAVDFNATYQTTEDAALGCFIIFPSVF